MLVAPASADFMAKLVHGRADDLLSLMCLARPIERCPLLRGAGDEPRDVGASGDAAQRARSCAPTAPRSSAPAAATRPAAKSATAACSSRSSCSKSWSRSSSPRSLAGKRGADHRRADLRADRPGARHHQSVERQDGLRDRARGARSRRRGHAGRRPGRACRRRAACAASTSAARSRCSTRCWPKRRAHDVFIATAAVADWRPATLGRAEDQEGRRRQAARARAHREPRHPRHRGGARRRAPRAGRTASASPPKATTCCAHARAKREKKGVPLMVGNIGPATFGQDDNALLLVDAHGARANCRAPTSSTPGARQLSPRSRARLARGTLHADTTRMATIDVEDPRPAHGRPAARLCHPRQRRPRPARLHRCAARRSSPGRRS